MAIPNQQQFAEWLQLVRTPLAIELPARGETITKVSWLAWTAEVRRLGEIRWNELTATPVGQWLSETKEISRARDLVFRAHMKKYPIKEESIDEIADWYLSTAAVTSSSASGRNEWLRSQMREWIRGPLKGSWTSICVEAIAEYFNPERPAQVARAHKDLADALDQARSAISRLKASTEAVESLHLPEARIRLSATFVRTLNEFGPLTEPLCLSGEAFPIGRLDAHSGERLFVFRMHRANVAITRGPRIEAIDELMGIEGFRHQYDRRTIERLCKEFTDRKRAIKAQKAPGLYME